MSYTPYAYTESQRGDFDRLKLLSDMSTQFNLGLRSNIVNDGSKIGLVLVDDLVRNATRSPGSFGLISLDNQTLRLPRLPRRCPPARTDTLRNDPSTGQTATAGFMWADADPPRLGHADARSAARPSAARTRIRSDPSRPSRRTRRARRIAMRLRLLRRTMWPSHDATVVRGLSCLHSRARAT